jgi:hypothetical protein
MLTQRTRSILQDLLSYENALTVFSTVNGNGSLTLEESWLHAGQVKSLIIIIFVRRSGESY